MKRKLIIIILIVIAIVFIIFGIRFSKEENINQEETIILYEGLEIEKTTGIQYEDYMEISEENKNKYEVTYYNYNKEGSLRETKGVFGNVNVYDGYSYVENVSKIAISEQYDAMPRKAQKLNEIPEKLIDLIDYNSVDIETIDLDDDGKQEYIVCVNQYVKQGDFEGVEENETYSEIMLFDNEFNKIATLASWENKGVEELSEEMCLQIEDVIYLDIDKDNNMEILINLPSYDTSLLSILKYSYGQIKGEIDYKVSLEP